MRIPTPSFDYNSLATPGGVGQGLASIAGAVVNARATQNKANAEAQGLARLEKRDQEDRILRERELAERSRANMAGEDLRKQELGLRGLESAGRGAVNVAKGLGSLFPNAKDQALTRKYNAEADRALRPPQPNAARDPSLIPAAVWNQLDQEATNEATDAMNRYKLSPEYTTALGASKAWFNKGPVPESPEQRFEKALQEARERRGLTRPQPWQTGQQPTPANAMPAAAGNIRSRVSGLFGGAIPPDWEQSIMEAEAGDAEALQQLEEMLAEPGSADTLNLGLDVGP